MMRKDLIITLVAAMLLLSPTVAFAQGEEDVSIGTDVQVLHTDAEGNEVKDTTTTTTTLEEETTTTTTTVPEGEDGLEDPGTLPDSPLYGWKRFMERVRLWTTFKQEAKVQLQMKFAERRLAEAEKMQAKGNQGQADKMMARYQYHMEEAERFRAMLEEQGTTDETIDAWMEQTTNKHIRVLERVKANAPEAAQSGLQNALQRAEANQAKIKARIESKIENRQEKAEAAQERVQDQQQTDQQEANRQGNQQGNAGNGGQPPGG